MWDMKGKKDPESLDLKSKRVRIEKAGERAGARSQEDFCIVLTI